MLNRLYHKLIDLAATRYGMALMMLISFIESSFFPIPPDIMLVVIVLARRSAAWLAAFLCTIASMFGGLFGYFIGAVLFTSVGQPIIDAFGYGEKLSTFSQWYHDWGAWIVAFAGLTPFPYKVITIASGVVHLDLLIFIIASTLSRGIRFFAVSWLVYYFGPSAQVFIEKRLGLLFFVVFGSIILIFIALKFI